ncbi:MAG: RNA polymerase sigma factor [candidate division Zixibacteria bacterium]
MLEFRNLYESYANDIYRFALWLSGDRSEAEDITSDTFVRAWVRRSQIRTETLKAYLFAIARNIYLEHQRKRKLQVDLKDDYPDPAPGPDRLVESKQALRRVWNVLKTVSEVDRAAFILRVQHELSYDEIARVLGLSLANTKVKIHRVRKKLIATFIEEEVY